jgi:CubicO group peptidase (beta-lactamase class C family)
LRLRRSIALFLLLRLASSTALADKTYFPPPGDRWEKRAPDQVGMDASKLRIAIDFAKANETDFPRDFSTQEKIFGRKLGPLPKERAATNGIVLRHGYIVAEFGDTTHTDPTYSAAKSFLSTILAVALFHRLIRSVDDPVGNYVHDGGYDSPHNSKITWKHHAQQTSEWKGEMWGKDHRFLNEKEFGQGKMQPKALKEPGTRYEYNDVRMNRFALSLLRIFRRPLPDVLRAAIMEPIGASNTWRWVPYDNAVADVDGEKMVSVSGGSRWGGGLWISARDEARFGLLFLNKGKWRERQLFSETWVEEATTPSEQNRNYGYLWWLNGNGKQWPGAPTTSFAAVGHGGNTIWIDPEHDIVVVWRWHKGNGGEFFRLVVESVKP